MCENLEIEDRISESEFVAKVNGSSNSLSYTEMQFLRRFYSLPYDEQHVNSIGLHCQAFHVVMAQQKMRGNPCAMGRVHQ